MKFHIEDNDGAPNVIFDDEPSPRSWLLSFFLEEAQWSIQDFLDEMEKAKGGEGVPTGYRCNSVDVSFYPNRAVIEALWPEGGEDAEPEKTELSLAEARQLLLDWQIALKQWRAQRVEVAGQLR